jgi:hypothetical protein
VNALAVRARDGAGVILLVDAVALLAAGGLLYLAGAHDAAG